MSQKIAFFSSYLERIVLTLKGVELLYLNNKKKKEFGTKLLLYMFICLWRWKSGVSCWSLSFSVQFVKSLCLPGLFVNKNKSVNLQTSVT